MMGSFLTEPLFPLGDWRWAIGMAVCLLIMVVVWLHKERRWLFARTSLTSEPSTPIPNSGDTTTAYGGNEKRENPIIAIIILVALMVGGVSFVVSVINEPEMIWTHPALNAAGQERVQAECRMEAVKEVGSGWQAHFDMGRQAYVRDCLIAKGFVEIEVQDEGEESQ